MFWDQGYLGQHSTFYIQRMSLTVYWLEGDCHLTSWTNGVALHVFDCYSNPSGLMDSLTGLGFRLLENLEDGFLVFTILSLN